MDHLTEDDQEDLYLSGGHVQEDQHTNDNDLAIQKVEECSFSVSAQPNTGQICGPKVTSVCAKLEHLESELKKMGLEQLFKHKLSMSTILQIDAKAITDTLVKSNTDLAFLFLKKLMMVNATARNVKCTSVDYTDCDPSTELNLDLLLSGSTLGDMMNPLDIITALFLCSDGFVQQELALRMSMCQFAVPLLLPNCDTNQCTLMLWAMRDIVKKYRPQSLSESKGFIEERIVHSEIPMISFVRLGECSLSKSEILNKMLSTSQQDHDIFVHREMKCGDCPRTISNGIAEITWYLPCGEKNIDIFSEPVAVANLRGDIGSFQTQYSFLCQTSSAVFVFLGNTNLDFSILTKTHQQEKLYLVIHEQSRPFSLDSIKSLATSLGLTNSRILIKTKWKNRAEFVEELSKTVNKVVAHTTTKMQLEKMADVALKLGIHVDESHPDCQNAREIANTITEEINDTLSYKERQLPLQGQLWKELTAVQKEEFRLQKAGSENIEDYKTSLEEKKLQLREKQRLCDMSKGMSLFINGISSKSTEMREYFLKWMQINLDNLSRKKLSGLREQYKEKSKKSDNRREIKEIDRQLSNSSLGTEHFFREMGQIYEASVSLPESHPSHQQLQHLPRLCAQLLLDGFPLELVDGDACNIPLRWVTDVLAQLHELVSPNNKILVVTVLGVQSTGKSTLLNTMFGVQFAVSSGRCTRGASMLFIRISEDVRQTLNCDFLVIIDTEGLKSPELAQLDDCYEHDNELATLVVGLSDITIINIAMENAVEMKDILQIVVHAFLRMKEVGKRPKCQFVHQNVSDVSAHEKNLRDRNLLLQQLNEMTQAAAKMEKKGKYKSFTDVMEYNPDSGNWYIPGLWNGNPPMAPVNVGYSEAVYELKKNIIQNLRTCESSAKNIMEFCEWIRSLWNAVQHENFIFSFRNSLVADAYMRLCTEFNKWEWDFKKAMYTWVTNAEIKIKNFGTAILTHLKREAWSEFSNWETCLLDKLSHYFQQKDHHVYLVEGYKQDFANSAKSLRRELESSVINHLIAAADIKQAQAELDFIKIKYSQEIQNKVWALNEECQQKKDVMTDQELDRQFQEMWSNTVNNLDFLEQKPIDIFANVSYHLRVNLRDKGSHVSQELNKRNLKDCGLQPFICSAEHLITPHEQGQANFIRNEVEVLQMMADKIIDECKQFGRNQMDRKNDYHDTFIQEILCMIDLCLKRNEDLGTNTEFEVSLKQHICAVAVRQFQKMHEDFLSENDPYRCLIQNKEKFHADFKDLFYERDHGQKKAEEFTERCLRPAVEDFINRSLGPDIIGEMLTCREFTNKTVFQYSILLDLLEKDNFSEYFKYIQSYENYAKQWILDRILNRFLDTAALFRIENRHVESCICGINDAIMKAKKASVATVKDFVDIMCRELQDKLVISQDALGALMTLNNANHEQFSYWLIKCVKEMEQSLQVKLKETDIKKKLQSLHVKPQNELFDKIIGCGKQCPFCKAPCEAEGRAHTEHFVSLHRPQALGAHRWIQSDKLVTHICSYLVRTKKVFWSPATKYQPYQYKNYKSIYPDWKIVADKSLKVSDYWKYVLAKFNDSFARAYNAHDADIPLAWKSISTERAKDSLKTSFNIK